ncbi:MAG TPA: glutamate-1-semialdehyde 2,1-aminomutase [Terriglobia bacterium]
MKPSQSASDALFEQACGLIPGGVTSSARKLFPHLVFREAQGAHLRDADSNSYLDYHGAFGPILLGHNHPAVNRRVAEALERSALSGAGPTELEIELARKIHQHVPCAEKVQLCTSGSEAVFNAVRVARAFTGRPKIIKFQGCYHGTYDSVLVGGIGSWNPACAGVTRSERIGNIGRLDPGSGGILPAVLENTLVCTYNSLDEVEQALAAHSNQVAAILVEPIAHNMGCVLPKAGFLPGLRHLTAADGTLLIFDEVITGFRHHLGGYQAMCGVRPDLATLGKAMANGFPVAAVCGRAEIMDHFNTRPGGDTYFAGTFHGHPVGCAAALATLDVLERDPVHEHVFRLGERLRRGLADIHRRLGTGAVVAGFGSVFVTYFAPGPFESYDDCSRSDARKFIEYRQRLIARGIFEMPTNLKRGHISYSHTERDIDHTLQVAEDVVKTMFG